MKCWTGIDLGSTTTKSIVLDGEGRILGRGITNSRNNYDAACEIAQGEALIDARFTLVRRGLGAGEGGPRESGGSDGLLKIRPASEPFPDRLERSFRREQHLQQLRQLRETTLEEAEIHAGRYEDLENPSRAVEGIFQSMEEGAAELFAPGARRRSDFFRDIAGAQYLAMADETSRSAGVPYETLVGLFDKSILKVENRTLDLSFQTHIRSAVNRVMLELEGENGEREKLAGVVEEAAATSLDVVSSVGTGYGRARLPFPKERIRSEILCHGLGAHALFPGTATVLDIGGQDTKAIQVDGEGIVTSFQMNDRCAAGCGRYLGYIADEMNLGLHELGPLAETSRSPVKISSTCTVFAGAEIRDRLAIGQKREDILSGLHRSIILRAMSLLARSGGIHDEFTFTGGVAKNPAAVTALRRLVEEAYGERVLNISPDSIYTGALGGALFARRGPEDGEEEA